MRTPLQVSLLLLGTCVGACVVGACGGDPAALGPDDSMASEELANPADAQTIGTSLPDDVPMPADDVVADAAVETPADCSGPRPTWIGGTIEGSDGRALNALIGVDHEDASGTKIDADGHACGSAGAQCCGGYSWCVIPNPTLDPAGSTAAGLVHTWGRCVTAKVTEAFFEIYPKNATGHTDFSRYGEAAHQYQPITPGKRNDVGLRLPLEYAFGGNSGAVNGYITCGGRPVPPAQVTRVRAWSNGRGPDCGIEGFNASATVLGVGASGGTYYRIDYLEGGRCWAASQRYRLYMDVTCDGGKKTLEKLVDIRAGARPRVDWAY